MPSPRTRAVILTLLATTGAAFLPLAGTATATSGPCAGLGIHEAALCYLASVRRDDGNPCQEHPDWTIMSLAAAGRDLRHWRNPTGASPVAWLPLERSQLTRSADWIRHALAVLSVGEDPRAFAGFDLHAHLLTFYASGTWGFPEGYGDEEFALIYEAATRYDGASARIEATAQVLIDAQNADGGWNNVVGNGVSDLDSTGMALTALAAVNKLSSDAALRARVFLASKQQSDGGFPSRQGPSNVQATAWAIHAIRALGESPADWQHATTRKSPLDYLASMQNPGTGRIGSGCWSTAEALQALLGVTHPVGVRTDLHADADPVDLGQNVRFRAPVSLAWQEWRFGDGTNSSLPSPVHAYARAGDRVVSYRGHAPNGHVYSASRTLTVLSAAPTAVLLLSASMVGKREVVVASAVGSFDQDGVVTSFRFDWGDGTVSTSGEPFAKHAYARSGRYNVTLRVSDNDARESPAERASVEVVNRPPLARLPGEMTWHRAAPLRLDANATDADGDVLTLDWWIDGGVQLTGATPEHRFPELGRYLVRVTARDEEGATTTASMRVRIVNLPPVLDARVVAFDNGTYTLSAQAVDPDGPTPHVTWTLGRRELARGANATLTFTGGGSVNVTVIALDADGARTQVNLTVQPPTRVTPTNASDAPSVNDTRDPANATLQPEASPSTQGASHADGAGVRADARLATPSSTRSLQDRPPQVHVLSPAPNATLRDAFEVRLLATDPEGRLFRVGAQLDGQDLLLALDGEAFVARLNATRLSGGAHALTARAQDAEGNAAEVHVVFYVAGGNATKATLAPPAAPEATTLDAAPAEPVLAVPAGGLGLTLAAAGWLARLRRPGRGREA